MIAVAVTAALCLTPLFVIDDSEAAIINEGKVGLSVDVSSISDTDTDRLLTDASKQGIAYSALNAATGQDSETISNRWSLTEVSVTGMKNYRSAMGTDATGDRIENVRGMGYECTVSFTATVKAGYVGDMFAERDGVQELYKFIGYQSVPEGTKLKVEGTFTTNSYEHSTVNYFKTDGGERCISSENEERSQSSSFKGKLTCTLDPGSSVEKVRIYDVDTENKTDMKATINYDYGNVEKKDVVTDTEVFILTDIDKTMSNSKFEYVTSDGKNGGYNITMDLRSLIDAMGGVLRIAKAGDSWIDEDLPLPEYHYYGDDGGTCLFTSAGDPELRNDKSMGSFLKGLSGSKVSDSYEDVKSVADSAATSVNAGGSNGISPLLLVIIGVVIVAIVIAAVLLLKKKKTNE